MMPDALRAAIAGMGNALTREVGQATRALYTPLHEGSTVSDVRMDADLAYGEHQRHKLDVYWVPGTAPHAVVVYLHGGSFSAGDKRGFAHIGRYFARRGVLAVIANYRFVPEFSWPSGIEDIGAMVTWIGANAHEYGADPARIFLLGHSAGATHCACYLFAPDYPRDPRVAGGILVQGGYSVTKKDIGPADLLYFGEDETQYEHRSPISHVTRHRLPLMLAYAELEPTDLAIETLQMALTLARDGKPVPLISLNGHNHFSTVMAIGTDDDELGSAMIRFIEQVAR